MTVAIKKPDRMIFARRIDSIIMDVFGRSSGVEWSFKGDEENAGDDAQSFHRFRATANHIYPCKTGEVSITFSVCSFGLFLACRLSPHFDVALTEEEKALDRLLNQCGGYANGKVNLHLHPKRYSDQWADNACHAVRHHLFTIKHGARTYGDR